ncbi:GPR1/FUN34/YaaH family transporter [Fodinicola acaciae]|uniref:GPR1/FUN34/YaaH family transporter n=1 Tax=Fodinicola acaciae TaxID=2681555 RepID=UPI0013D55D08|nr:GPR1/FUN34/YaaH family transporter [Fodinicola acaciae]
MTAAHSAAEPYAPPEPVAQSASPAAAQSAFFAGNPAAVGLPAFIVGSIALGLVLVGYVPATAVGASLPIIAAATGLGLTIATLWAAGTGESAVASVFGIFAGFWLSYAVLVLGLTHGWFGIPPAAAVSAQGLFLITWLVVIVMLTLTTLRLPLAFTVLFALIDLALAAVLVGTLQGSAGWLRLGGILVFAAVGVYLYAGVAAATTGGAALPLGKPLIR